MLIHCAVSLEKDVMPHLGSTRVPDDLIKRLGKYLQTASRLYTLNLPGNGDGGAKEARFDDDFDRQASGRVHGTTAEVLEVGRERFAYWCFEMLFSWASDSEQGVSVARCVAMNLTTFCVEHSAERQRIATLCLPSLLNRCAAAIKTYVADAPLRGKMPFPRFVIFRPVVRAVTDASQCTTRGVDLCAAAIAHAATGRRNALHRAGFSLDDRHDAPLTSPHSLASPPLVAWPFVPTPSAVHLAPLALDAFPFHHLGVHPVASSRSDRQHHVPRTAGWIHRRKDWSVECDRRRGCCSARVAYSASAGRGDGERTRPLIRFPLRSICKIQFRLVVYPSIA